MNIVSIHTGHNASTTLMMDGEIIFHIEEERLSRTKRDATPFLTLMKVAEYVSHIDHLLITYIRPPAVSERFGINYYEALLGKIGVKVGNVELLDEKHHLCHAMTSAYNSGFDKAIVLVVDGAGSRFKEFNDSAEYESIYKFDNEELVLQRKKLGNTYRQIRSLTYTKRIENSPLPAIGMTYTTITSLIGFGRDDSGKTMGLSAYGRENSEIPQLIDPLTRRVNRKIYNTAGHMYINKRFDIPYKQGNGIAIQSNKKQYKSDLAYRVQKDSEKAMEMLVREAIELIPDTKNICLSGGYALNVINNYELLKKFPEYNFWFDPTCYDGGNSIGICKYWNNLHSTKVKYKQLDSLYLGLAPEKADLDKFDNITTAKTSPQEVADLIHKGNIVAIYQGKCEAGPRALGNRSFMFTPTLAYSKKIMNKVKNREEFRPFAASVLEEHAPDWFDMLHIEKAPFMMIGFPTKEDKKKEIPGVVHVDGTTRIQTVSEKDNKVYREIIEEFYKLSGVPMIMNTSFNLAGEPLVETIEDAIKTLTEANFNYLYLADEGLLLKKIKYKLNFEEL